MQQREQKEAADLKAATGSKSSQIVPAKTITTKTAKAKNILSTEAVTFSRSQREQPSSLSRQLNDVELDHFKKNKEENPLPAPDRDKMLELVARDKRLKVFKASERLKPEKANIAEASPDDLGITNPSGLTPVDLDPVKGTHAHRNLLRKDLGKG